MWGFGWVPVLPPAPISRNFQVLKEGEVRGSPGWGDISRAPPRWRELGTLRAHDGAGAGSWRGAGGAPEIAAGRGTPFSASLSSAPLLLVSLADAAARGGGSSRGTRGRERG